MRSEIPENVDVMLEQPQVDAGGIVVIQPSQSSLSEQLGNFSYRAGKEEGVIHHDPEVFLDGQIDELLTLRNVAGEGFFDEDMLAIFKSGLGQLIVGPHRSDDGNGIDVGRSDDLHRVRGDVHAGISFVGALLRRGTHLRDGPNLGTLQAGKVPDHIGSPITVADYTEVHGIVTTLSALLMTQSRTAPTGVVLDRNNGIQKGS